MARAGKERLQERENRVAVDAETDDAAAAVDLGDRVCRNEPAPARQEARAHGDRVRDVRRGAVHRRLHRAHDPALRVSDERADRAAELRTRSARRPEPTPGLGRTTAACVRVLLTIGAGHFAAGPRLLLTIGSWMSRRVTCAS